MEESELPEQNSHIYFQSHAQSESLKPPFCGALGVGAHTPGQDGRALLKTLLVRLLAGSSEPPVPGVVVVGAPWLIPFGSFTSLLEFIIYGDCKGQSVRWEP